MAKKKSNKQTGKEVNEDSVSKSAQRKNNRAKKREAKAAQKRRSQLTQIAIASLAVIAVVAALAWPRAGVKAVSQVRLINDPQVGAEAAPVIITEFGDFGCHGCQAWHEAGIKDQILEDYGDKVQFVWKDFPVITHQSPKAAEAGQCAHDQDMFWEFHDLVYESHAGLAINTLKRHAATVGLDVDAFNTCLDSGQHEATVAHDLEFSRNLRLRGTPSFRVNGRTLPGPPGYQQLAGIIENELATSN